MATFQNDLYLSKNPYLLQHKDNPVAWKTWNTKAFDEARHRNVPLLVSIGYATCHWCHVMAHEVFEDTAAASLMNESLVCIKVDREENPEVDEIYMEACQAMNGNGGWPLNIFIDHDGKPFFSATYVPLENWKDLLQKINNAWINNSADLLAYSNGLASALKQDYLLEKKADNQDYQQQLYLYLEEYFDEVDPDFSGSGRSPRFPSHTLYYNLLCRRTLPVKIGGMLTDILTAIQDSGLHDRVGGGFHRYSTDAAWRVPHFEKMLYDNAQLISAFAMAGNRFNRPDFTRTAEHAADYMIRDLSVFQNEYFMGYASAEDADDPGGEGSFYSWIPSQLSAILGESIGQSLAAEWNITDNPENIHGVYPFRIPHPRGSESFKQDLPSLQMKKRMEWEKHYPALLHERQKRPRPFRDSKVLSDWNALALTSMCLLFANTRIKVYGEEAQKLSDILLGRMKDENIERMPGKDGHLTDYSHTAFALFTAWETFGDERYLNAAELLVKKAFENFTTPMGIVYSSLQGENLFMRYEEKADNTQPAGAHSLLLTWVRLSAHQRLLEYRPLVEKIITRRKKLAADHPITVPAFLTAVYEFENGPVTLRLPETFRENQVGLLHWVGTEVRLIPDINQKESFQVCEKDHCLLPVKSENELEIQLKYEDAV